MRENRGQIRTAFWHHRQRLCTREERITCKELGADFDRTEDKVKQRFRLSDADAAENMRLYW